MNTKPWDGSHPPPAPEATAPRLRPIVVGSTWCWLGVNEEVRVTCIDYGAVQFHALPNGIPFVYAEELFRQVMTWVSDSASGSGRNESEDMVLAKRWRKTEIDANHPYRGERSLPESLDCASRLAIIAKLINVIRERDAALARIRALECAQK